jgi:hypothetical protein
MQHAPTAQLQVLPQREDRWRPGIVLARRGQAARRRRRRLLRRLLLRPPLSCTPPGRA